jgi:SAM-dependent methyltransferase
MNIIAERIGKGAWVPVWVRHQHEARYAWAAQHARGLIVLDAACGTGYGTKRLIENGARSVRGFDLSAEAIAVARHENMSEQATFETCDVTKLPVAERSIDLFLSFETIEHLPEDRAFIAEVRRVLRESGRLICSTPNRHVTNPGSTITDKPFNPFHTREYTQAELLERLKSQFRQIRFFGQSWYSLPYISFLQRLARLHPRVAVRFHQVRKLLGSPWESPARHWPSQCLGDPNEPEILIAVCDV